MINLGRPDHAMTRAAWAKFDRFTEKSYPLWAHLEDAAAVADQLYEEWLSKSQKQLLIQTFGDAQLAKKLTIWLAAAHDAGKATSAFAIKAPGQQYQMELAGFIFPRNTPPAADQRAFPHGRAGQVAVESYLDSLADSYPAQKSKFAIAEMVGGHHGQFPTDGPIPAPYGTNEDPGWSAVRQELLRRADQIAELTEEDWHTILSADITEPVQAILTGFLIVCDWIASDADLFPFITDRKASEQARLALEALQFGEHWKPTEVTTTEDYFSSRFRIDTPRPVQTEAVTLANSLNEPSLILVEAPTGEGKTEIALATAEVLAKKFGLHGLMVALPTRATSDAMFGRVLGWLDSSIGDAERVSATLAHGKAQFDQEMQALPRAHSYRTIYGDHHDSPVVVHEWFSGRKKSIFHDFVVGTVDQLLFGALKAKHLVLRHLGLSSKVIVIDEIHAADTFMQTYLHRVLEWLGAYGVPVVALSATLLPSQRKALLEAYRRGAQSGKVTKRRRRDRSGDPLIEEYADNPSYPLITAISGTESIQISPPKSDRRTTFSISEVAGGSDEDLVSSVLSEASAGGCIAVVLDTVDRAQRIFAAINEAFDGEVELFHSRFTAESRSRRERELVRRLGKGADRPSSMIVVATQVIEASLDVDFDMMFTDFAPTDLLIQRMGRVHRHNRPLEQRPPSMRTPRIILSGGSGILEGMEPPVFDRGVAKVYGNSHLYRSALALRALFGGRGRNEVGIPEDVPGLIRATYAEDPDVPEEWKNQFEEADAKQKEHEADQAHRSRAFAINSPGRGNIVNWSRLAMKEASEEVGAAQVRDAELSVEVVIIQKKDSRLYSLPWLPDGYGDVEVGLREIEAPLARQVATCTVSLPSWLTMGPNLDKVLDDLEGNGIEGWQTSYWLRGVLPLILDENLQTTLNGYVVRYDRDLGLLVEREAVK
ncbi:CRISPR-associated helicase Cas3' [Actinomycetaceae bacterium MB13-C1-2]|nr:CRISPR-associated helicase Cas3' [Actinomycetaceae bacterium MB13-C1-2]